MDANDLCNKYLKNRLITNKRPTGYIAHPSKKNSIHSYKSNSLKSYTKIFGKFSKWSNHSPEQKISYNYNKSNFLKSYTQIFG